MLMNVTREIRYVLTGMTLYFTIVLKVSNLLVVNS